tara:strand:- start:272 stop:1207 length:936 start_codon:yes stop_codon:yes gene_type:complete
MYTVLSITIPFFAIIFLGTFFKSQKIFDDNSSIILTRFALYVTLPPFIFINIIKASNKIIFNWDFILRFEFVTLLLLFFSFFISKFILKNNYKNSSIFSLNTAYPNYGYMGIPLSIIAFGENAAIPISIILLSDSLILFTFTAFTADYSIKKNFLDKFVFIIKRILKNPILMSVFIGFIFVFFKVQINSIINEILTILAYAAPPTALFALGITLWNKLDIKILNSIVFIVIIRLIIHPLLIYIVFLIIPSNVPLLWIKVAILCSCLPVASNVFAMSVYYNSYIKETSNSVMISSILSTISVPIVLFLLLRY